MVRNAGQAGIGMAVMAYLLCHHPMSGWWRPHKWWIAALGLICSGLVVMGGFRSTLVYYLMMVFVATGYYSPQLDTSFGGDGRFSPGETLPMGSLIYSDPGQDRIDFQNRLLVVLRWTISFVTRGRGARLMVTQLDPPARHAAAEESAPVASGSSR